MTDTSRRGCEAGRYLDPILQLRELKEAMSMTGHSFSIFHWLLNLFNPPPLKSMTLRQKVSRIFLITITLLTICILSSMLVTLGIFLAERGSRLLADVPHLASVFEIVFISACVNTICVMALFQIKKFDHKLMESHEPPAPLKKEETDPIHISSEVKAPPGT